MEGAFYNGGRGLPPMVVGEPIWEGVWPNLDPMECVCVCVLRTACMEWNVPGRYGPHGGEHCFFLRQKEPAIVQDSVTFSPFINADIRTPFFSDDVLKKCALLALHLIAEEGRNADGCHAPGLGTNGKGAAQRVQCGKVKVKLGRKTRVCLLVALEKALG